MLYWYKNKTIDNLLIYTKIQIEKITVLKRQRDVQPFAHTLQHREKFKEATLNENHYLCSKQSSANTTSIMNKKQILTAALCAAMALPTMAQGWPTNYDGVMLQGFYWDSYTDSQWSKLEKQAPEWGQYFSLLWVPQSGKCLESYNVMGYTPYYYFNHNSSFGTEAELRSMIQAMKRNGVGVVADVVVNHHNTSGWFSFPKEEWNGQTYQLLSTDIVANDDNGNAAAQAEIAGVSLSSNQDEGDDFMGMRDLDHKSANVQAVVKAYEQFLVQDLGYSGFRYDMVKGFDGSHVADYNRAAGVDFSVGEYFDGNVSKVKSWIDRAEKQSAAFDFPFRYTVRDAINKGDWSQLANKNTLVGDENYRRYAVTFVENHDTQYRSATEQNDPIRKDTLAANAYLLAMPGTPCVFLSHLQAYPQDVKAMIDARHLAGVTSTSSYSTYRSTQAYYAVTTQGTRGKLLAVMGSGMAEPDASFYIKVLSGHHYAYYLSPEVESAWVDLASGSYADGTMQATLTAVSATKEAQLVYTLDGSEPTASSTKATSGSKVTIPLGETVLKVGLLIGGKVSGVVTRQYSLSAFEPYNITVSVNADAAGWTDYINFHSWGGSHTGTNWPGDHVTTTQTVGGKKWFCKSYTMATPSDEVNFVFSIGTSQNANQNQTVNVNSVNHDAFFEITGEKDGGKYLVKDVTDAMSIEGVHESDARTMDDAYYTLAGQRIEQPTQHGIYLHKGKKILVK